MLNQYGIVCSVNEVETQLCLEQSAFLISVTDCFSPTMV